MCFPWFLLNFSFHYNLSEYSYSWFCPLLVWFMVHLIMNWFINLFVISSDHFYSMCYKYNNNTKITEVKQLTNTLHLYCFPLRYSLNLRNAKWFRDYHESRWTTKYSTNNESKSSVHSEHKNTNNYNQIYSNLGNW